MANLLKNLKLSELSLVDAGANQHAAVTIFKRDNAASEIVKGLYSEGDILDANGNPRMTDFRAILENKKNREKVWEVREEVWPMLDALSESINSVLVDANVNDKMPAIERQVQAFLDAVREKLPDVEEELMKFFKDLSADNFSNIDNIEKDKGQMAETKTIEELTKALEDATAKLEKAEAIAKMSDEEKAYMAKMDDAGKAAFMAMSAAERAKKMEGVKKNDETVTVAGQTISKSAVGAETFAIFKAQSEAIEKAEAEIAKVREAAAMTAFEKRAASEFANLPGTDVEKAHVLKAVAGLEDTVAKSAIEAIMKAANDANGKMFETLGKKSGEVEKSLDSKIEKLATEIAKRDNISKTAAIAKAWSENPELYNEYEGRE